MENKRNESIKKPQEPRNDTSDYSWGDNPQYVHHQNPDKPRPMPRPRLSRKIKPIQADSTGASGEQGETIYEKIVDPETMDKTVFVKPSFPEETLELFFESARKFPPKGLNVDNVRIDETKQEAVVTFKCYSDVKLLLERHSKEPCVLEGKTLFIEQRIESLDQERSDIMQTSTPPQNEGETDTILVTCIKEGTSEDCLRFYFENMNASGGGLIKGNPTFQGSTRQEAVIVFEDKNVVPRVLSRQHVLEGQVLTVQPFITSRKELLLSGLSTEMSEEALTNFLEAKLKDSPKQITYSQDRTKAVAGFDNDIDFDAIKRACQQPVFESQVTASTVPLTSSIILTNLPGSVTLDTVFYYFQNERRSHGGPVETIDLHLEDGYVVVTFKDYKVVNVVCSKMDHKLCETNIIVAPYHRCLGLTSECPSANVTLPDAILLSEFDVNKVKFLSNRTNWKEGFMLELKKECNANVVWDDPSRIECDLTKNTAGFHKLVKEWASNVKDKVSKILENFTEKKISYPGDMADEISNEIDTLSVNNPEDMIVLFKKEEHELILVCTTSVADLTARQLSDAINKVENDVKAKREVVEECCPVTPLKAKYLDRVGIIKDLSETYKNLEVCIDIENGKISFKGPRGDVQNGKCQMLQQLQNLSSYHCEILPGKLKLLKTDDVKARVNQNLKDEGFFDLWDVAGDKLILHGEESTDFTKMEMIVCKPIETLTYNKNQDLKKIFSSEKWTAKEQELQTNFNGFIDISNNENSLVIHVIDTKKMMVTNHLKSFTEKNTVIQEKFTYDGQICRFFNQVLKDTLDTKLAELRKNGTTVSIDNSGTVVIEGIDDSIKKAKNIIEELKGGIVQCPEIIRTTGVGLFVTLPQGMNLIQQVEKSTPCIICTRDSNLCNSSVIKKHGAQEMYEKTTSCAEVTVNGIELTVVGGNILEQDVEAIVSPANKGLKLYGGIAGKLLTQGGPAVEADCKNRVQSKGILNPGDIHVGDAGKLPFKKIIHAMGPTWKGGSNNEESDLKTVIEKCLQACELEQLESVAIPALSTGVSGYPVDKACDIIVRTVADYVKGSNPCLKKVLFCDVKKATLDAFTRLLQFSYEHTKVHENMGGKLKPRPSWIMQADASSAASSKRQLKMGSLTVEIVKGHLANEKTDVIVNSTSSDLRLNMGQASKALQKAAGESLQQEANQKYPKGIRPGDVAVTSGANLACKNVFHVTLKRYEEDNELECFRMMQKTVKECLLKANKDGLRSIAFPTLGTGGQHYPKQKVAQTILETISSFAEKTNNPSLTNVRIVVFNQDDNTFKAFKAAETDWTSHNGSGDHEADKAGRPQTGSNISHKELKSGNNYAVFQLGPLRVSGSTGDVTREATDCIVASCSKDLNLRKGKVTEAILKAGGDSILQECESHKKDMASKGIVMIKGGKLKARNVILIEVQSKLWKWKSLILSCLQKADECRMTSMAMPLFGTNTGIKAEDITQTIYRAIIEFLQDGTPKHLKQVKIVVFGQTEDDSMVKAVIRKLREGVTAAKENQPASRTPKSGSPRLLSDGSSEKLLNECRLTVLATDQSLVKIAVDKLKRILSTEWTKRDYKDECVSRLTPKEISVLQTLAEKNHVLLSIDKAAETIRLTGFAKECIIVSDQMHIYLSNHVRTQAHKIQAQMLQNEVVWGYLKDKKFIKFSQEDNMKLESAYKKNESKVTIYDRSKVEYVVNIVNMEEYCKAKPNQKFSVIRHDKMEENRFNLPKAWDPMPKEDNLLRVEVKQGSPEYKKVIDRFAKSLGRMPTIKKIERIQNKSLWAQYDVKRQQIEANNPQIQHNEKKLWHGTAVDAIDSINNHGFNRSYCGKNGTAYGNGVYFAVSAAYSDGYAFPHSGGKSIFLVSVLVGETTAGRGGMRVPPCKNPAQPHMLYDSVCDNPSNPSMFIVFNDTQAYPSYLITYN